MKTYNIGKRDSDENVKETGIETKPVKIDEKNYNADLTINGEWTESGYTFKKFRLPEISGSRWMGW